MRPVERKWLWHSGTGLGVALFPAYRGQRKTDVYLKDCPRATAPFFTGLVSGNLRIVDNSNSYLDDYSPGDTTFGDPDVKRGKVTIEITRDGTVLMCIGPVSIGEKPEFVWAPLNKALRLAQANARTFTLETGHVGALIRGEARATDGVVFAPGVLFARKGSMEVELQPDSILMEGWR